MDAQVIAATREDEGRLRALFELYTYDFSDLLGLDVEDDGRFRVRPLERYWTDPLCHPFLVRVDAKLAGFALVQRRSRLSGEEGIADMDQFFVLRRYRRHGVGEQCARWLFDRFPGRWEVRQEEANRAATAFWRRVIGRYTGGRFDDLVGDPRWRGTVQTFDSGRSDR